LTHATIVHEELEELRARVASLEAQLAASEIPGSGDFERRRLAAIVDALPVGIWLTNAAGGVLHANPAAATIYGGRAPLSSKVDEYGEYEAFWPETGERVRPEEWPIARTLRTGEPVERVQLDIRRFDGTRGHVLISAVPLPQTGGGHGAVVVVVDITEQQDLLREREKLLASLDFERQRLGTLVEKAPATLAVLRGPEHVYQLVNEAYGRMIGRGDVVGQRIADAVPEIVGQGLIEVLDRIYQTGEPFAAKALPARIARSPGGPPEERFFDVLYQPLVEADASRSGIFGWGIEVTENVRKAERLRAQFKAMPVPTYAWQRVDRDGKREFVLADFNDAAASITKGAIERQLGATASEFFGGDDDNEIAEDIENALTEDRVIRREMDYTLRSLGDKKRFLVTYVPVQPDCVLAHTEDLTARAELEEQLRSAMKMEAIGRLAGGVAHDFNNILSVIVGYTALLLNDLSEHDPMRHDILEISTAVDRAVALTRQLLALGRVQVLQPRAVDLAESLSALEKMLGRLLGEDVELAVRTPPDLGLVLADPTQIDQVIINLAVNARDAMPTGGTLTIELQNVTFDTVAAAIHLDVHPGDYVMIAVSDTGTGMDEATKARIFEPFFTTKEQGKGTGLGLATVFGIVRQSGGHVWVYSERGQGSTFKVYLPRYQGVSPPPVARPHRGDVPRGTETVLVVEDDDQVRAIAAAVLRRLGYTVLEAQNGGEALLVCEQHPEAIHLVLTDVVMPRMSGRHLAERLATVRPGMKVLFMSGYTDDAVVRHGVLASGLAFLQKPVAPAVLARKVRSVLDG
jgi:PAS domain S-box-containing protein